MPKYGTLTIPTALYPGDMGLSFNAETVSAAGEGFAQTTLSATAPVFTFNGTPTAVGKTYLVVRTCGP